MTDPSHGQVDLLRLSFVITRNSAEPKAGMNLRLSLYPKDSFYFYLVFLTLH